ncbi:hypothetical protein [Breznakia pachnodae]|uniref:Uncharacterized protein n=1 Tax=Breznakia pachnodae TaxID=265178 RepID=A0ABU0E3N7_9FIRM|nr:hypothetical protein [Breznakia pachnodae]MDQ0361513.1 hypothetical protein [Breznakia pachnodae]
MNENNYKKYVDEVNKNNKIKEHLQEIPNKKSSKKYTKPIVALAMVVCLVIVSVFALQNNNSKPEKKKETPKTADVIPNSRKGDDGLVYLKEDVDYPNNIGISDTPLYDTLPVYENVELEYSSDGYVNQSITDIISQEQMEEDYVEPIEKILNLDPNDRTRTDNVTDWGVTTSISYSYPNGVSFTIDLHIYVAIYFENPQEYGIKDGESANEFALKVLEEFTGKPYETYNYTSAFDNPPKSNRKGYVTRSDVNDMMKTFEKMNYHLFKGDNGDELSISLPNYFGLSKAADKKMISTKQALENLKNDYGVGPTEYPDFGDPNADYEALFQEYDTIIQNALSDETYEDVLSIELYNSRHWSSYNYVYPSYLVLIKIPDDVETNAEPGETPCIIVMVTATELIHTPRE